jgi:magnesium transporter
MAVEKNFEKRSIIPVALVRKLIHRNARSHLKKIFERAYPVDVAQLLSALWGTERLQAFSMLHDECEAPRVASVLSEMSPDNSVALLASLEPIGIARLLSEMPADDGTYLTSRLPDELAAHVLSLMESAPAAEVRELLVHEDRTAGRIMTRDYFALEEDITVSEAVTALQTRSDEFEMIFYIYVVDKRNHLVGVVSLRRLLTTSPSSQLSRIMNPEVISVKTEMGQEEVARLVAEYNLLAVPVTDAEGKIAGIVTVDDVIDVLQEEFNEAYMRLVGSDAEEMAKRSPLQIARLRLPWLIGTMIIELFAGVVIARFDYVLREIILLASFMPVISAISGNVGLQAAAITVRGLDTGHVRIGTWGRVLSKEIVASLVMASVCGVILGVIGVIWAAHVTFGLVVGGAMTCSMVTASCMGTIIPMVSRSLGFDPAATAGPFETAFQDVIGFAVFLWLASLLLPWLK